MVPLLLLILSFGSEIAQSGATPLSASNITAHALKQKILNYHNYMRHFSAIGVTPGPDGTKNVHPSASNMVNLVWDDALANIAQTQVEICEYRPNSLRNEQLYNNRNSMTKFKCDKLTCEVGENIGYSTEQYAEEAVLNGLQYMYTESNYWHWDTDLCDTEPCKHYTQMAWANTRVIGCGWSLCPTLSTDCDSSSCSSSVSNAIYYVCNYWPVGNEYDSNIYETGTACSNCPWDHYGCKYNASLSLIYDPNWSNMPEDIDEFSDGLCIGCGNEYYEICRYGENSTNCASNIAIDGCDYVWDADSNGISVQTQTQVCDPQNDAVNGFEDAMNCTLEDTCKYQCGTCFCHGNKLVDAFTACSQECDDGLGQNINGSCAGETYWIQYINEIGGCPTIAPTTASPTSSTRIPTDITITSTTQSISDMPTTTTLIVSSSTGYSVHIKQISVWMLMALYFILM